jgi:hypothetical protein
MTADHPFKSIVKGKHNSPGALASARTLTEQDAGSQRCLSAVVPALAEPIIHSLPQAPKSRRTRLSWCSLPVSKQSWEPQESKLHRSIGRRRDLAACTPYDLDCFSFVAVFESPSRSLDLSQVCMFTGRLRLSKLVPCGPMEVCRDRMVTNWSR